MDISRRKVTVAGSVMLDGLSFAVKTLGLAAVWICVAAAERAWASEASEFRGGLWKEITYEQPTDLPVVFGGESRCTDARAEQYCVYLDMWYDDGTPVWAVRANWQPGTHDWEKTTGAFVPKRPIRKIRMHAFLRMGTGQARFRNLWLERRPGTGEVVHVMRRWNRPFGTGAEEVACAFRGREIVERRRTVPQDDSPRCGTVAANGFAVWAADSARKITPLTFPTAQECAERAAVHLDVAGRESESFQIQVTTGVDREWSQGGVELPVLKDAAGRPFPGRIAWARVGYLARSLDARVHTHPCTDVDDRELWIPDPLLPPAPYRVRKGSTQGLWLTVQAEPNATPGVYSGDVVITEGGVSRGRVTLSVRVRAFSLPQTFGMRTAYSVMDGFTRATYPNDFERMKRRTWDLMLDHRLNPDDITRTDPPRVEDLLYARSRGMNSFNVLNLVPKPKDGKSLWTCWVLPSATAGEAFYREIRERLDPYYAQLRRHGLEKMGYLYGFDERPREHYANIDALWRKLRVDYPSWPLMTTAKMYKDMARGQTNIPHVLTSDWFCPIIDDWNDALTERLHAQGKQVWWYTCCGPGYPYANMASLEAPAIEGRILGWMTHLYRADGFLFWHVNYWTPGDSPILDATDVFFPGWKTYHSGLCPGDGVFLYPGRDDVYPSIRLALVRDGEEDYEWLQMATQRAGIDAVDKISRTLIRSRTDFTRDPANVHAARAKLADLIACPDPAVEFRKRGAYEKTGARGHD